MDDGIRVDTELLRSAVQMLNSYNNAIAKQFNDTESVVWKMRQGWNGPAHMKAREYFERIKYTYNEARWDVISQYTGALRRTAESYETTEDKIYSEAEAIV